MLERLLFSDLSYRLAWTLVHSLWQGAVIAGLLAIALAVVDKRHSNLRYILSCGAMLAMLLGFVATAWLIRPPSPPVVTEATPPAPLTVESPDSAPAIPLVPPIGEHAFSGAAPEFPPSATSSVPAVQTAGESLDAPLPIMRDRSGSWLGRLMGTLGPWVTFLAPLWLLGVAGLAIRNLGGLLVVDRLARSGCPDVPPEWTAMLRNLSTRLGVRRPVKLLSSLSKHGPLILGHLKPVILIPAGLLTNLPAEQVEAILAHELAHIRRGDYLVNLIQTVVETLFFHHPATWWISRCIRNERECCADALAAEVTAGKLPYAEALVALAKLVPSAAPLQAVAADGGSLLSRIRRLLGAENRITFRLRSWITVLLIAAACLAIPLFVGVAGSRSHPEPPPVGQELSDVEGVSLVRIGTRSGTSMSSGGGYLRTSGTDLLSILYSAGNDMGPIIVRAELPPGRYSLDARTDLGVRRALVDKICRVYSEAFDCRVSRRLIETEVTVMTCPDPEAVRLTRVNSGNGFYSHTPLPNYGFRWEFSINPASLAWFAGRTERHLGQRWVASQEPKRVPAKGLRQRDGTPRDLQRNARHAIQ
jgi:beta-lactamase regulating signal transducer with metallopeptidase domain